MKYLILIIGGMLVAAMAAATVVEKIAGPATAVSAVYGSWWFAAGWALLAVLSLAFMLKRKLERRVPTFMLHSSFLVILLGAAITHFWGGQGSVHLREGIPTAEYVDQERLVRPLPFVLTLDHFSIQYYPGTDAPMDYVSLITVRHHGDSEIDAFGAGPSPIEARVAMNDVFSHQGYRFYMASYDSDQRGSLLRVSHDSWGMGVSYAGYALLLLSIIAFFFDPRSHFRQLWRGAAMCVLLLGLASCHKAEDNAPRTIPRQQAAELSGLLMDYNQRICPMSTLAADVSLKLYGKLGYRGLTAEQVLAGWIFFPDSWMREPVKQSHGARAEMENAELANIQQLLASGTLLRLYPVEVEGEILWASPMDYLPQDVPAEEQIFVRKGLGYLSELAARGQWSDFSQVVSKLKEYQIAKGDYTVPSPTRVKAETLYNHLHIYLPIAIFLICSGLLFYIYFIVTMEGARPWVAVLSYLVTALTFCLLLFLVSLRGYVAGHWPLSNGFETMLCMAICALAGGLIFGNRWRLALPFGLIIAGLAMIVAMLGDKNPQITPLMPVLASPLLSIHVAIVMVAYALLAFAMLGGITGIFCQAAGRAEQSRSLARIDLMMLYPAVFCLALGIFIGAIWANESWGRYWGWDPKETWALITMLVYAFALHGGTYRWLRSPMHLHIYCVVAFLCVIITYFGVNFLLGGLHSYA
ncbi:MAG: cytochrome c biogenesis protein CcsA [Bacteroidales bacterium]|nr:cytochrome c biogenesis protein CcsA [Bacteroidales bacterium]